MSQTVCVLSSGSMLMSGKLRLVVRLLSGHIQASDQVDI